MNWVFWQVAVEVASSRCKTALNAPLKLISVHPLVVPFTCEPVNPRLFPNGPRGSKILSYPMMFSSLYKPVFGDCAVIGSTIFSTRQR